ncbi:hypothetical protein GLOTRDRAFT_129288 [Gloeophyllum trabeum ATCC 11539]|uniref:Uncharacterized protein n=1 Tax=Gloeophyllum trabeum (strain ATCC 11539 / FP-39264 / Madison 617) TaxID=670483 RepID=S7RQ17_GLOTA|nr:uncharacterized protein GLOTRDRAFT_129288 [Gloeophyllum trabeum ATCC 11539]EPQ54979.1 hypothetical protein GLOTRDRAFT_129288 [Gloeophyllum trabeum ATCC 11539]
MPRHARGYRILLNLHRLSLPHPPASPRTNTTDDPSLRTDDGLFTTEIDRLGVSSGAVYEMLPVRSPGCPA